MVAKVTLENAWWVVTMVTLDTVVACDFSFVHCCFDDVTDLKIVLLKTILPARQRPPPALTDQEPVC